MGTAGPSLCLDTFGRAPASSDFRRRQRLPEWAGSLGKETEWSGVWEPALSG